MRFEFIPAEDDSVDAEIRLLDDEGAETPIKIQVAAFGGRTDYLVIEESGSGADWGIAYLSEHRTRKAAQTAALADFARVTAVDQVTGPFIVAFQGGGCDGEYLDASGESVTRERGQARPFRTRESAIRYMEGRLLGLNRPKAAVVIEPMRA